MEHWVLNTPSLQYSGSAIFHGVGVSEARLNTRWFHDSVRLRLLKSCPGLPINNETKIPASQSMMQEIEDYFKQVTHLPPATRVLPQLLMLLSQPDIDISQVVELVRYDPALTANVLQICNSAYLGAARPAADLEEAVARLGFDNVYRMVATITAGRSIMALEKNGVVEQGELWKHLVTTAVAAQLMAADRAADEGVVFTAALLHDIGKIVLAQALGNIYANVLQVAHLNQASLLETEKKLLGVHHAEIGGRLLAGWQFPPNLVAAVSFHHQPAAANPHHGLAAYVYLGNLIAHFLGHGYGQQPFAFTGRSESLAALDFLEGDLPRYAMQTQENFKKVEALLKIDFKPPARSATQAAPCRSAT
jgi:putative nucleotidyltransferase with HDIG domain